MRHGSLVSRCVAPESCFIDGPPEKSEGAGKAGWPHAPGLSRRKNCASASPQVQAVITPAFPAQWFYGLYVISPVNLADCHRRPSRSSSASLGLARQPLGG